MTLLETTAQTSFTLSGQAPGSTCTFRMFVTNVIGQGPYSSTLEVLFAVAPGEQTSAPEFVGRSGGDAEHNLAPYITIKWQPPLDDGGADILGYLVELDHTDDSASSWTTVYDGSSQPHILEFTFQDASIITAGQTYSFRTYSRNIAGLSGASDTIEIMAATVPA